ncbi:hypothetical protein [Stenotrophomonas muris]|uniref:hypothetical protein n=1 Tax=Stenotrophomonas muris TaxID=2963283 RepID=UPI00300F2C66
MKKMAMASAFAAMMAPALAHGADFMGIELGAKFDMPECEIERTNYSSRYIYDSDQPVTPCWEHSILDGKPGDYLDTAGTFKINFIADGAKRPAGVRSNAVKLIVVSGVVEGVEAATGGYEYQDRLLQALVTKFGKPTSLSSETMQNRMGATFDSHEAIWKTKVLEVNFSGMGSSTDFGHITVYSPKATAFVEEEYERKQKAAPSF